jgi:hypothetical protein
MPNRRPRVRDALIHRLLDNENRNVDYILITNCKEFGKGLISKTLKYLEINQKRSAMRSPTL